MIAPLEPATDSAAWNEESLAHTLRLDLEDEERRALLGSYAISTTLGLAFLLLQQFGPRSEQVLSLLPERGPAIIVRNLGADPPSPTMSRNVKTSTRGSISRDPFHSRASDGAGDRGAGARISSAFDARSGSRGGGIPTDVGGLLRGVAVEIGKGEAGVATDAKLVLGFGEGGQGSTIPGRSGFGGEPGSERGIGGVRSGGNVGRAVVSVTGPSVVAVAPPTTDGGGAAALGTFVRGREPELRFCYEENLKLNPSLAGSVTVSITVSAGGGIADAGVTDRTWSGRGAMEAEACMLRMIRGWRLAGPGHAAGTYSFPFSFTR